MLTKERGENLRRKRRGRLKRRYRQDSPGDTGVNWHGWESGERHRKTRGEEELWGKVRRDPTRDRKTPPIVKKKNTEREKLQTRGGEGGGGGIGETITGPVAS